MKNIIWHSWGERHRRALIRKNVSDKDTLKFVVASETVAVEFTLAIGRRRRQTGAPGCTAWHLAKCSKLPHDPEQVRCDIRPACPYLGSCYEFYNSGIGALSFWEKHKPASHEIPPSFSRLLEEAMDWKLWVPLRDICIANEAEILALQDKLPVRCSHCDGKGVIERTAGTMGSILASGGGRAASTGADGTMLEGGERIDAKRARELLVETGPGPWRFHWVAEPGSSSFADIRDSANGCIAEAGVATDAALIAAAPDLARTVIALTEERDQWGRDLETACQTIDKLRTERDVALATNTLTIDRLRKELTAACVAELKKDVTKKNDPQNLILELSALFRNAGSASLKISYEPRTDDFVIHWVEPDGTSYGTTATELEDVLTRLVRRMGGP